MSVSGWPTNKLLRRALAEAAESTMSRRNEWSWSEEARPLMYAVNQFSEALFRFGSPGRVVTDEIVIAALKRLHDEGNGGYLMCHGKIYCEGKNPADLDTLGLREHVDSIKRELEKFA